MAQDHHVRIILEAINKGGSNLANFFRENDKEVRKFRKSIRDTSNEIKIFPGFGGTATAKGPGGLFVAVKKDADAATKSVRSFREELRQAFSGGSLGQAVSGFSSGLGEEKAIREEVDRRLKLSKEEKEKELALFKENVAKRKNIRDKDFEDDMSGRKDRILAEKLEADAETDLERIKKNAVQDRINIQREALTKRGFNEEEVADNKKINSLLQQKRVYDEIIKTRIDLRDRNIAAIKDEISAERRLRNTRFDNEVARQRGLITGKVSPVTIEQDVRRSFSGLQDVDSDVDRVDNRFRRFGLNAGRALGQFRGGLRIARDGLSDVEKEMLKTSSAATRLGARFGNVLSPITAFRGRIVALIAILQIAGTLIVQFGAALVALASSAILAAAALGGALLAGLTQLVPVVGLLVAAFSRLGDVLDAAALADKIKLTSTEDQKAKLDSIKQATQQLADSRYSLVKAGEAVKDSEFELVQAGQAVKDAFKNQTDAIKELAEARRQAARDIVDANFEEREAALALQEATLGILEAKQRLREEEQRNQLNVANIEDAKAQLKEAQARLAQVRGEGDESEITLALQQLSVAEQDLQQIQAQAQETQNTVKQAQIDIKQADLQHEEAVVRNRRAQIDAAEARKKGVAGSDRVKSAQENLVQSTKAIAQAERQQVLATRALRDSVHSLVIAKREEKDAESGLTDVKKKATAQQQQLQQALGDLTPAERKLFKSIQKIKEIYKKNFRPITDIIINAFTRAVDTIAPLLQDPKILKGAKALATAIAESIDKLASFTVSPEFKEFLTFSIGEAAKNVPKITDGFVALARVLIRVAKAATPIFDELIDRFVKFLDRLDERTKNPKGLNDFFAIAGKHLDSWIAFAGAVGRILGLVIKFSAPSGKGILEDLTDKLNEWSDWMSENKEEVKKFFADVRVQVGQLSAGLARMAVVLFKAFSSKTAASLTIFILDTVIPAFALFLQLIGLISGGLVAIFEIPLIGPLAQNTIKFGLALLFTIKLLKTILPLFKLLSSAFTLLFTAAGRASIILVFNKALAGLAIAIKVVGAALRFVFITNPWIAIIVAIIAAVVLLDRKFHFIRPTIEFLGKLFVKIFNWIKDHWKLLTVILLGPFGLVVLGIIKWRDKILELIKSVVGWVRDHWKLLLVALLLAPFSLGGLIILGIIKFRERLLELVRAIPGLIVKAFEKLPGLLLNIFKKIPGLLKDALKGLAGIVKSALQKIPVVGRFFGGGKSDKEKTAAEVRENKIFASLPNRAKVRARILKREGEPLKNILRQLVKEDLIDSDDIVALAEKFGPSGILFAHGGQVPGGEGSAVPIIAHAGEWVLNKMQQMKLAKNLGMNVEQLKMNIFGTKMPPGQQRMTIAGKKTKPTTKASPFSIPGRFNLSPQEDPDGNVVWFIEMADGAFGQVSQKDARKIINSKGRYIPGYVRRSSHGFKQQKIPARARGFLRAKGIVPRFLEGGVVVPRFAGPMIQSFAEGGTVMQQAGFGAPSAVSNNKNIEQNFNVTTQGETDWNYVMRLGALHAQGSYT